MPGNLLAAGAVLVLWTLVMLLWTATTRFSALAKAGVDLKTAPPGRWIGPIQSPRGWHFVKQGERIPSAMIAFPAIRDQVRQDYMIAHSEAAIGKAMTGLKEKYDVEE